MCGFLIQRRISRFFFDRKFTGRNYKYNPKIIVTVVRGSTPSMSSYNESNWSNPSPWTRVQIYWIFAPVTSVPNAARFILKFRRNNKNPSGYSLSKKNIKSQRSDKDDVGSLRNFSLTKYLSGLSSLLLLIRRTGGGSTCIYVIPKSQEFLWETFFTVKWLGCVRLCQAIYLQSFIRPE